jgi:hypothetical protein
LERAPSEGVVSTSYRNLHWYKNLYNLYILNLTWILPFSTVIGMLTGFEEYHNHLKKKEVTFLICMIGYTSFGLITGLFYPISFPLLSYKLLISYKTKSFWNVMHY